MIIALHRKGPLNSPKKESQAEAGESIPSKTHEGENVCETPSPPEETQGPKMHDQGSEQQEKRQKMKLRKEMMQKRQQIRILQQELKAMSQIAAPKVSKITDYPQPDGYCFQFRLQRPNPAAEDEFYCTAVDEAAAWNMMLVKKTILETIPKIKNRRFALRWVDTEGDEITLSTNQALKMALNESSGPMVK